MPERYGPYFEILQLPADLAQFNTYLHPNEAEEAPAVAKLSELLLRHCRTVVVESDYIDSDYRSCYSRFYYMRHSDLPRRCTRLHFFNEEITGADLINIPAPKRATYRGFVVIRPLPTSWLGRSVLSYKLLDESVRKRDESLSYYLTCNAQYTPNLAGNALPFTGAPWIQQDTMVSACASASIWVVSCHMSTRFAPDFKMFFSPSITDFATKTNVEGGRAMPSRGLTTQQMMYALREMGFEPIIYSVLDANTHREARKQLYYYVESGLPVILGLEFERGGHALTVVGHALDLDAKVKLLRMEQLTYCSSSDYVPAFIAQDDMGGPFRVVEFLPWGFRVPFSGRDVRRRFICPVRIDGKEQALLKAMIVPLPGEVSFRAGEAEDRARRGVAQWLVECESVEKPLVFRTFLERSNDFKARILSDGFPRDLAIHIRRQLMSRWVWVTEISRVEEYGLPTRAAIGHWLHDSASFSRRPYHAEKFSSDTSEVILWHMPGAFLAVGPDGKAKPVHVAYNSFPRLHRADLDEAVERP